MKKFIAILISVITIGLMLKSLKDQKNNPKQQSQLIQIQSFLKLATLVVSLIEQIKMLKVQEHK